MEHPRFEDVCPIENGENLHLVMLGISGVHVSFREYTLITNWGLSNPKGFFGLTKISFWEAQPYWRLENVTKWPDLWNSSVLRAWNAFRKSFGVLFSFPGWKGDDFGCCRKSPNPKMAEKKPFFWVVATQTFFMFIPKFGEMIQFDDHIFQMGWFNHQHIFVVFSNVLPNVVGIHLFRSESHMFQPFPGR